MQYFLAVGQGRIEVQQIGEGGELQVLASEPMKAVDVCLRIEGPTEVRLSASLTPRIMVIPGSC